MNRNAWAAIIATIAVVMVVILGFRALGSPTTQRRVQSDLHLVRALSTLAQQINQRWLASGKVLPANLEQFPRTVTQDPITGQSFIYRPQSNTEYELCATFATDNLDLQTTSPDDHPNDHWLHPKGDHCFRFEASRPVPVVPYY
jgi:hypothetical protein